MGAYTMLNEKLPYTKPHKRYKAKERISPKIINMPAIDILNIPHNQYTVKNKVTINDDLKDVDDKFQFKKFRPTTKKV